MYEGDSRDGGIITYLLPGDTAEDEEQNYLLKQLLGMNPKRKKRSIVQSKQAGYGCTPADYMQPLEPPSAYYNPEATELLMDWMFQQSEDVQVAALAFLSDPDDERRLKTVLKLIDKTVEDIQPTPPSTTSLTDLVLRVLPAKIDDLYAMARDQHRAKRPEAAIRQILRRKIEEGVITMREGIYYDSRRVHIG